MSMESVTGLNFGGQNDREAKIIAELQGLSIGGPLAGAGSGVAIALAAIEFEDTILKCIEFASGVPADRTSVTTIVDRRAFGTLTVDAALASGDTVVVNGKTYTFTEMTESIATNVGPRIIPIVIGPSGVDVTVVAARLAKVIMSSDNALLCTSALGVVTIIARAAGSGGNSITLSVAGSNAHVARSGAVLTGGTATNAIKVAAVTTGNTLLVFWYNKNP